MNKFELDKVMECLGFEIKNCYEINGCKYYHDGRYFTIVDGKTPYELALLIRNKYNNDVTKTRELTYNAKGNLEEDKIYDV